MQNNHCWWTRLETSLNLMDVCFHCGDQRLLFPSLVVKNVVLRQRAAVDVADGGFRHRHAPVLKGTIGVPLSAESWGKRRVGQRWAKQAGCIAVAVSLGVNAVQVLGHADASSVQQILAQEVALCR